MVVEVGGELVAPTIELEIEEAGACLCHEGEETMIASPGVVGGTHEITDMGQKTRGDALMEESLDAFGLRSNNEKEFVTNQDFQSKADITVIHFS